MPKANSVTLEACTYSQGLLELAPPIGPWVKCEPGGARLAG